MSTLQTIIIIVSFIIFFGRLFFGVFKRFSPFDLANDTNAAAIAEQNNINTAGNDFGVTSCGAIFGEYTIPNLNSHTARVNNHSSNENSENSNNINHDSAGVDNADAKTHKQEESKVSRSSQQHDAANSRIAKSSSLSALNANRSPRQVPYHSVY